MSYSYKFLSGVAIADAAFQVNVAKVRVTLPADLRDQVARSFDLFVRAAQAAYRDAGANKSPTNGSAARLHMDGREVRKALEFAANQSGTTNSLKLISRELKKEAPGVARFLGLVARKS